tara:strand:+ start:17556 stop:18182 length:627 start_codon:yes stop_codon:yes gene_type:complete
MYGFDEETGASSSGSRIPAGITENVSLKDVVYEPLKADGSGDDVLKFLFSDIASSSFTHIEFPIDADRLTELAKGWGKSQADAESYVKQQFEAQGERIKHILSCFIPKDKCVFRAKNFQEFAEGVIKMLGETYLETPCRVKIVYKKNSQYTTFPNRAFKPFIQPMSEPNRLKIDPKWDIVEAAAPDTSGDAWSDNEKATATTEDTAPW